MRTAWTSCQWQKRSSSSRWTPSILATQSRRENLTIEEVKREIFEDIRAFHPDVTPEYSPYDVAYKEILKSYYKQTPTTVGSSGAFKHP